VNEEMVPKTSGLKNKRRLLTNSSSHTTRSQNDPKNGGTKMLLGMSQNNSE